MKENIKEQWLTDLRSGEFEQGRNQLYCDGKFCCLGVLEYRYHRERGLSHEEAVAEIEHWAALSDDAVEWAGLGNVSHPSNPMIGDWSLAELNDGGSGVRYREPKTFNELADLIEENL